MEYRILENPDLKNAVEDLFGTVNHGTQVLYIIILLFFLLVSGLMAIIQVPVYVETRGTLRPSSDKKQISSPVQGIIRMVYVEENQKVRKNEPILIIDSEKERAQVELIERELILTGEWIQDCQYLTNKTPADFDVLRTAKYQTEFLLNEQEQQILESEIKQLKTDISRLKSLEKDSLISKKELEDIELKYANLIGKQKSGISFKRTQWLAQLDNFRQTQTSLLKEKYSLEHYIKEAEIRSPASGTIQGIRNIFAGDFCPQGKQVCIVVPDTGIVAEMFIPSQDIGFIKPGMKTRFKIDAFDYKYWGFLEGKCISISNDYEIYDNLPFFRVICQPEGPCQLSFGNKTVFLTPGMTLTSQFVFTSRNIWQLIRDKIYNWLDGDY